VKNEKVRQPIADRGFVFDHKNSRFRLFHGSELG
jgi:hypothetical protein